MPDYEQWTTQELGEEWWQQYQNLQAGGEDITMGDVLGTSNFYFEANAPFLQGAIEGVEPPDWWWDVMAEDMGLGDLAYDPDFQSSLHFASDLDFPEQNPYYQGSGDIDPFSWGQQGEFTEEMREWLENNQLGIYGTNQLGWLMMHDPMSQGLLGLDIDPSAHYEIGEVSDIQRDMLKTKYLSGDVQDYLSSVGSSGMPVSRGQQNILGLKEQYTNEMANIGMQEEEAYSDLFGGYGESYYDQLGSMAESGYFDPFQAGIEYSDSWLMESSEEMDALYDAIDQGFDMEGCLNNYIASAQDAGDLTPGISGNAAQFCQGEALSWSQGG